MNEKIEALVTRYYREIEPRSFGRTTSEIAREIITEAWQQAQAEQREARAYEQTYRGYVIQIVPARGYEVVIYRDPEHDPFAPVLVEETCEQDLEFCIAAARDRVDEQPSALPMEEVVE